VQDVYVAPTWKRTPQVKVAESHEPLSSQTRKWSCVDIEDLELPRKKKQVSQDAGKTLI